MLVLVHFFHSLVRNTVMEICSNRWQEHVEKKKNQWRTHLGAKKMYSFSLLAKIPRTYGISTALQLCPLAQFSSSKLPKPPPSDALELAVLICTQV